MEATRRRDSSSPPVVPDLAGANSFLSVENSDVRLHPIENSVKARWTNEKHDLYLDHLESSFVKQLQQSILKNHSRRMAKQRFVRSAKVHDNNTSMNLCPQDKNIFFNEKSLDYFEEFSDQNFPDEASEQMCVTAMSKRSKTIVS